MHHTRRWAATTAATLLALAVTTGCAPDPAPSPSPTATGFASEKEAFAAAEAVYRAYVDAVNARRADSASTDPSSFLTGSALRDSIDSTAALAEAGVHIVGSALVDSFEPVSASSNSATFNVCVDSSQTHVVDVNGADVTPVDRPDRMALEIEIIYAVPAPLVIRSDALGDHPC